LGGETWLIFRRPCRISDNYREIVDRLWGEPRLQLRHVKNVELLDDFDAIRDATAAGFPLIGQTEISNRELQVRAVMEYPIKTMNVSLDKSMYQVDTGPVALPDLTRRYDRPIESLRLAFVAFNAPHLADFVIEQPTPVIEDEQELAQVYHYSKPISLEATNKLFASRV